MRLRRALPSGKQLLLLVAALTITSGSATADFTSGTKLMRAERHNLATATSRSDMPERPVLHSDLEDVKRIEAHAADSGKITNACGLDICLLHARSAPRLFVAEHNDGMGHRMQNVMDGMAIAVKNKMNFGGVQPLKQGPLKKFRNVTDLFFGHNASSAMFHAVPFDEQFSDSVSLERRRSQFKDSSNIFLPSTDQWQSNGANSSEYYTPALKAALRQSLDARKLTFAGGKPKVAMHVRRGDLRKTEGRSMKDEYFFRVADDVRKILPEAEFHVWSSTENWSDELQEFGKKYWQNEDFNGYRQRGMVVHLDNKDDEDLVSAWAHLARADVLLMSRSSFSYVPAALSDGCVIHPGMAPSMNVWVDGTNEKRKGYLQDLKACIDRALSARPHEKTPSAS